MVNYMSKTTSDIDQFQIYWQAFDQKEFTVNKTETDIKWILYRVKAQEESLSQFIIENKDRIIIPKYFINGIDFSTWCNANLYGGEILDTPLHLQNALFVFHQGNYKFLPSLKLTLYQLLGHKINLTKLKEFGFDLENKNINWLEIEREENEDIPLYCCGCGDRMCGYFPLKITKKTHSIEWEFSSEHPSFHFEINAYQKEFQELMDYLQFTI